jgi:predicted nucleic acid-binding protein
MKMLIKNISLVIVDVNSNIIFSSIIFDKNSNEMFFIGNC